MKGTKPPKFAEKILAVLSSSRKTGVLGDSEEEYLMILTEKGRFRAYLWYISQIFKPLPFLIRSSLYWSFEMLKNNFVFFLRSLKRKKLYSFINISGLAVGLACCILISLWIDFETGYDRFFENSDNLYQIVGEQPLPNGDRLFFTNTPGALAHALKIERPEIRNVSRLVDGAEMMLGTEDKRFLEKVRFVDPAFLEMFTLEFVQGNPQTALSHPDSIILTEDIAEKYFAGEDVLGREIRLGADKNLLVTGVIKKLPENSFLRSLCLIPVQVLGDLGWRIDEWLGGNYDAYIQLEEGIEQEFFKTQIRDFYKKHAENWAESKLTFRPITDIHLYNLNGGGPIVYVYIFAGLTIFILLLAIINFINLSTARSVQRAKEIGIRKMVGAYRRQLTKQILLESIFVTVFSAGLALIIAYFLRPVMNQLTGVQITFGFSGKMAFFLAVIMLLTGVISGLYPAFYLSSLNPVRAVNRGIDPGKNRLSLRKILIVFQFSLSIFMVIATLGLNKQLMFLQTKDLGYSRDNIVSLGLAREISQQYEVVRTELKQNPEIVSLTRSSSTMDRANTTTGGDAITWEGQPEDKIMPKTHLLRADPEFIETFQIQMAEGRFFSREFPLDRTESVVLNETALKTMALKSPLGKRITVWGRNFRIIGVIKDFHFYSLRDEIQPLIFINRYAGFQNIFIRIHSPDLPETLSFIRNKLKEVSPGYVPDLKFLDNNLHNIYLNEQRVEKLTKYFSALAIFISCIGLLGLVSFSSGQRAKEIAIRKVLGASGGNVLFQLIKEILICVAAANIFVWPVAYLALRSWLQNYAYHTNPGIGVFAFASILTLVIAVLSVGGNVLKASLADPVDSLRYE